jgi:hypothetical protein
MRWKILLLSMAAFLVLLLPPPGALSQQNSTAVHSSPPPSAAGTASLKVCLRLEDESRFGGLASIRVMPSQGYEIAGTPTASEGEILFSGMQPGTYSVEVASAGFLAVRITTTIESAHQQRTLFVVMKPRPLPSRITLAKPASSATTANAASRQGSWLPPNLDEAVPEVDPNVECPAQQVLRGVGQRMTQFVSNLEKFSATERVEHFNIDGTGARRPSDLRSFDYVVMVSQNSQGTFVLDEFRNGSVDPEQFPAHIATEGLPAMALIFHPILAGDFKFECEGLGQWRDLPAWQVHFSQRPDKPSRIRAYIIGGKNYRIPIKGRVWIDPGTFQVLRLESDLVNPLKEIELTNERCSIEYGLVQFRSLKQEIWLPQTADLWVERQGHRYYRRHTFSDFKVFSVDTAQSVQKPKESYSFTNTSDRDLFGVLTVSPVSGTKLDPVSIRFTIPAGGSILKLVGPGKDVDIPVRLIESAVFVHNGRAESIKVDAYLVKESSLDVIPETAIPSTP